MEIRFSVVGKLVGAQRPRVTRNGTFIPKKTRQYQEKIKQAFAASGGRKIDGAVCMRIEVFRALPKSRPKKVESEPDIYRPDVDNIAKCVMDALNGLAYDDDAQVVSLRVTKYPRIRREERIIVTIWPQGEEYGDITV